MIGRFLAKKQKTAIELRFFLREKEFGEPAKH